MHICVTRFDNKTIEENKKWKQQNNEIGCIYGTPIKITEKILPEEEILVLEMNNSTNKIEGIGIIKNNLLNDSNVKIDILDPFCESSKVKNLFKNSRVYKDLNDIKIDFYNAALIVTDHDTINYDKLIKYSKIIIDTRGRLKNKKSKKIYII